VEIKLDITNVYAPNNPIKKINLWELLKGKNSKGCNQILCGGKNMVELKRRQIFNMWVQIILEKMKLS
jgi:hypothetical protein